MGRLQSVAQPHIWTREEEKPFHELPLEDQRQG